MIRNQLLIQARFYPEMLERVLRVVRHRGFLVCTINMSPIVNTHNVSIELTVASQRSVALLFAQLNKLMDVICVEIHQ